MKMQRRGWGVVEGWIVWEGRGDVRGRRVSEGGVDFDQDIFWAQ